MTDEIDSKRLRLYLIRHGQVEGSAQGKVLGWTDAPLSERGREQAQQIAIALGESKLSAVYSSDLVRASVMARHIAEQRLIKVRVDASWREINMGDWDGRTIASLNDDAPELVAQLFDDPASFQYPGGESFAAFIDRIQSALDNLLNTHKSGEVALVAHGGVCRTIIGRALGMPPRNWLRLAQDYGCLNVIDWYDGHPLVQLLNGRSISPERSV